MFVTEARAQTETPAAETTVPVHGENPASHGEVVGIENEHESGVFPPMDTTYFPSQILWLAITFGLFYLVLQKIILPRIGAIIEDRRDRIALDLKAAERLKLDADEAQAAYEQALAEARERSQKIAMDARDSAKADADAERAKLEADLDRKLEAAQTRIGVVKNAALADVNQIAEEAAQAILSAVAGLDVPRDEVVGAVRAVRS